MASSRHRSDPNHPRILFTFVPSQRPQRGPINHVAGNLGNNLEVLSGSNKGRTATVQRDEATFNGAGHPGSQRILFSIKSLGLTLMLSSVEAHVSGLSRVLSDVVTALETSLLHASLVPSSPRQGSSPPPRSAYARYTHCVPSSRARLRPQAYERTMPATGFYELQTNTSLDQRQRYIHRSSSSPVDPCSCFEGDSPPFRGAMVGLAENSGEFSENSSGSIIAGKGIEIVWNFWGKIFCVVKRGFKFRESTRCVCFIWI